MTGASLVLAVLAALVPAQIQPILSDGRLRAGLKPCAASAVCSFTRGPAFSGPAWHQPPAQRDAAKPPAAATVRGRVTSADGRPLHRVRITLNGGPANPPTTVTDTRGAYELVDVPPGSYSMTAVRAGYLSVQYGQRRPREAGRQLEVQASETIEGIDIVMPRGGVLAGRIVDEAGDPAPGARVEAIELRYIRGRRVPVPARIVTTNDAGEYRLSGLEPGAYQVRASATEVWDSEDRKQTYAFAVTWYPGVSGAEPPQTMNVGVGQEIGGLDFRLVPAPAARIVGVVQDANGTPLASQVVNLDRIMRTTGGALLGAGFGASARTDAKGMFELAKLAPGEYNAYTGTDANRVAMPVLLSEGETKNIVLTPRAPSSLVGAIAADDGSRIPFPASRLRVTAVSADPALVLPNWSSPRDPTPAADWTFRFFNIEQSHYLFRVVGLPVEWMLRAVMVGERDVTDTPIEIASGTGEIRGLRIVLSQGGAKVSGTVVDRDGASAPDTTVVLFAEDRARWGVASRFVRAVRPDRNGRFSIAGLPPAVYRVAAKDVVIEGQWEDPDFLQALMKDAVRVELAERASETVTLTAREER